MNILENHSLQSYHTFALVAKARYFARITSIAMLREVISLGHQPLMILGGGSNVMFTKDYPGLIVQNAISGIRIIDEGPDFVRIEVGGGVVWHDLVQWAITHNLGGLENLSLIPGTVGAAPIQNIGAYGVEFDSVFHSLTAVEIATGSTKVFDKEDCQFNYRDSVFKRDLKGHYFISSVQLNLNKPPHELHLQYGDIQTKLTEKDISNPTIKDVSDIVIAIRQSKLPDPKLIGNGGSFFKNPVINYSEFEALLHLYPDVPSYDVDVDRKKIPAAWLIEKAGWKGYREGDAGVYDKHALVLVNYGSATGQDMHALAQAIQDSVDGIFGIKLEMEVNMI